MIVAGGEIDPTVWGIRRIKPPGAEDSFWEIIAEDGEIMLTTEMVTIQYKRKEKKTEAQEPRVRKLRIRKEE